MSLSFSRCNSNVDVSTSIPKNVRVVVGPCVAATGTPRLPKVCSAIARYSWPCWELSAPMNRKSSR